MTPFTTAERKVLGVAAPTTQQTPLNWPYLPWPNPYNLQPRLTGYANQIYVQAVTQALVHDRHSPGERHAHPPPPHQARRRQRLRRAQSEPVRRNRRELEPHHGAPARRRGVDFPDRRRHRHHEHSARLGDRTHARDRPAHGDRRAPHCTCCCSFSPKRSFSASAAGSPASSRAWRCRRRSRWCSTGRRRCR